MKSDEPQLNLLLELDPEVARWRRRTMFLVSVMWHALLITFVLVAPDLFRRGAQMMGIANPARATRQSTFLWIPPEVLRRLREPPQTNTLSDRNRRAQGRSPVIDPNGLRMPYSRGNTQLPDIAGGKPPTPAPTPPAAASQPAPPPGSPSPNKEEKEEARLRLMDVPAPAPPAGGGDSRLRLPLSTPGEAIQQSVEAAARGRGGSGSSVGPGDSPDQFNNVHPNFSTEAPIILSDTRGVDFGPYLARIVYIVRRNWYAVIPEAAMLGQKGRVAIDFTIMKDGSVPELQNVASSGFDSLDRAALAGIRASIPFPPLPDEFTGDHLRLRFIFLYNLGYTQ